MAKLANGSKITSKEIINYIDKLKSTSKLVHNLANEYEVAYLQKVPCCYLPYSN